jgi:hypothetical protein
MFDADTPSSDTASEPHYIFKFYRRQRVDIDGPTRRLQHTRRYGHHADGSSVDIVRATEKRSWYEQQQINILERATVRTSDHGSLNLRQQNPSSTLTGSPTRQRPTQSPRTVDRASTHSTASTRSCNACGHEVGGAREVRDQPSGRTKQMVQLEEHANQINWRSATANGATANGRCGRRQPAHCLGDEARLQPKSQVICLVSV